IQITVAPEAQIFLKGLNSEIFTLLPGQTHDIGMEPIPFSDNLLTGDELYGASFTVQVQEIDPGPVVKQLGPTQRYYVYFYEDASDDNDNDGLLKFADTFNDGSKGVVRQRFVDYLGEAAERPTRGVDSPTGEFQGSPNASGFVFTFAPMVTADNR